MGQLSRLLPPMKSRMFSWVDRGQVRRIDTSPIFAFVMQMKSFGNRAVNLNVISPMRDMTGKPLLIDRAISGVICLALPYPASGLSVFYIRRPWVLHGVMAANVLNGMALQAISRSVRFLGDGCRLAASAHAQPGWIRRGRRLAKTMILRAEKRTVFVIRIARSHVKYNSTRQTNLWSRDSLGMRHFSSPFTTLRGVAAPGQLTLRPAFACPNYTPHNQIQRKAGR
jgi:hypothetical protein